MRRLSELSTRELRRISAYLDGELTPQEANAFERMLKEDSELAGALEEIRNTRKLLSSLPQYRAPRNFTLTPEMVGVRKYRPAPFLRYATVVAALAFTLVVGTDVWFNMAGSVMSRTAPAMEAAADMAVEEPAADDAELMENTAGAAEAAPEAAMEQPEAEMQAAGQELPPMSAEEQIEAEGTMDVLEEAPVEERIVSEMEEAEALEPALESGAPRETQTPVTGLEDADSTIMGDDEAVSKAAGEESVPAPGSELDQLDEERRASETAPDTGRFMVFARWMSPVRVLEIILGTVSVILAALWIRARRRI